LRHWEGRGKGKEGEEGREAGYRSLYHIGSVKAVQAIDSGRGEEGGRWILEGFKEWRRQRRRQKSGG
jgi:hypothetical protein